MKNGKMPELTADEREYLADNRKTKTVPELAAALKRGDATIYAYFKLKDWKPYRTPDAFKRDKTHPFRRQNVKLERFLTACKINREAKN